MDLFLIIASYHFGREDTAFLHQGNYYVDQALYLIKGSLIVFAPLFFHIDETIEIFETLLISDNILIYIKKEHWIINVCLGFCIFGYLYFVKKNKYEDFEVLFLDMLSSGHSN